MIGSGLEGWLKESTAGQKGTILIYCKVLIIDFTSDAPLVVSGSHNLSNAASVSNDENYLVLRHPDIADCYGVEVMRIYGHYGYRYAVEDDPTAPALDATDAWAKRYYMAGSLEEADRMKFVGR